MAFPLIFWQHYSWSWLLRCEVKLQRRRSMENILFAINFSFELTESWKADIIKNLNDASRNPEEVYNSMTKLRFWINLNWINLDFELIKSSIANQNRAFIKNLSARIQTFITTSKITWTTKVFRSISCYWIQSFAGIRLKLFKNSSRKYESVGDLNF